MTVALLTAAIGVTPAAPPARDTFPAAQPTPTPQPAAQIDLPKTVGVWTRPDTAAVYGAETLFDYMNGGAEIYLGYRYDRTEVYEYLTADEDLDDIVVELYWMGSSDDAYGLLSNDWRGTPIDLGGDTSASRALYDGGLLRVWSDDLFARVMAYTESPTSKEAVLEIGRAAVRGRPQSAPPAYLESVPASIGDGLGLLSDRVCFFRSHHVLNVVRFVATANILELDESTAGVIAGYRAADAPEDARPVWLVRIRYASAERANRALASFVQGYPTKGEPATDALGADERGALEGQRGWAGFGRVDRELLLALDAPDEAAARAIVDQLAGGR